MIFPRGPTTTIIHHFLFFSRMTRPLIHRIRIINGIILLEITIRKCKFSTPTLCFGEFNPRARTTRYYCPYYKSTTATVVKPKQNMENEWKEREQRDLPRMLSFINWPATRSWFFHARLSKISPMPAAVPQPRIISPPIGGRAAQRTFLGGSQHPTDNHLESSLGDSLRT